VLLIKPSFIVYHFADKLPLHINRGSWCGVSCLFVHVCFDKFVIRTR